MPGVAFNIAHRSPPKDDVDEFLWAEEERRKFGRKVKDVKSDAWELDVRALIGSNKWLSLHGLKKKKLKLYQILTHIGFRHTDGYIKSLKKPVGSYYGEGLFKQMKTSGGQLYNITVGKETLMEIESNLKHSLYTLKRRHEWLNSGSRKMFGVIQEHIICIVLDVSTMVQSQFDMFREALIETLQDQVSQIVKFNIIRAQSDMQCWQSSAVAVTDVTLKQAESWVWSLDRMAEMSTTSCTEAVLKALEDESLEAVYLFTEGDVSESAKELLCQKLQGTPVPIHPVSFNATKPSTLQFFRRIADECSGSFHAFVVKSQYEDDEEVVVGRNTYQGNGASGVRLSAQTRGGVPSGGGVREDVFIVWKEMEECRNVLSDIQTLMRSIEADSEQSLSNALIKKDLSSVKEMNMSSKEWLRLHGLSTQKLTVYHALASCAFKHIDDVIELKNKPGNVDEDSLLKLIEAKYCKNFPHMQWKDGTIVHVYISAELFRSYQRKVNITLDKIQQRIDWLQQGSREVFGSILEERVYFLLDASYSMSENLDRLKESVLQLFQEQLRHKTQFNIIKYESQAVCWRPRLDDVTEDNLLDAWQWVKDMVPGGSTNTLAALRLALADPHTEGIYLLTDGRPDQPPHCVLSQVQLRKPVPIHTISFNCHDTKANTFLHQLALDTGGRYHCYTTHGGLPYGPAPFESEDIALLKSEMKRGKHDLKKVSDLRDQCVMLDWFYNRDGSKNPECLKMMNEPRPTAPCCRVRQPKERFPATTNGTEIPDSPSLTLGMKTQPTLLAISHKEHRGQYGVNDRSAPITYRSEPGASILKSDSFQRPSKKKKKPKKRIRPTTNTEWLKLHGLLPRRLTLMDALAPPVVKQKSKYIPILDKHIVSKVFDDVLPLAHVSPRSKKEIQLVNPNAVDLKLYKTKLNDQLDIYKRRLFNQVMPRLDDEKQKKFETVEIFWEDIDAVTQILIDNHWPTDEDEYRVLVEEVNLGEVYLVQLEALKKAASENTLNKRTEKKTTDEKSPGKKDKKIKTKLVKKERKKKKEEKEKDSQSSDETTSVSTLSDTSDEVHHTVKMNDMLLHLTGTPVIARYNIDGFYYDAVVLECLDVRFAHVRFIDGDNQVTSTRHIIPINKDLMLPPLKLGDYVLARVKSSETGQYIYYPGMVLELPQKKKLQVRSGTYKVILYGELHKRFSRRNLVKISEARYHLTRQYIRIQLERHDQDPLYETAESVSETGGSSISSTTVSMITPLEEYEEVTPVVTSPEESAELKSIQNKLEHLHEMLLHQAKEYEEMKERNQNRVSRGTSPMEFEIFHKNIGTSDDGPDPVLVAFDEEKNSVAITQGDSGVVVSREVPDVASAVGTEVLSQWLDDGWYYRGTISRQIDDNNYEVVDSSGCSTLFTKSQLIFDEDDVNIEITVNDKVVALHPMYKNSYAPASVTGISNEGFHVLYYNGESDVKRRDEVYSITKERHASVVAHIIKCEKAWVGQAVVARNEQDGCYHLASCLKQMGSSRSYQIQWSDGDKSVQHITCMFGTYTRQRDMDVGNFVIALRDNKSFIYLPGFISEKNKQNYEVEFCDRSQNTVLRHHCYFISKEYYELAVAFFSEKSAEIY